MRTKKQMMDLKIPVIANPGKSTMCIAYKYGETQEKNNRVRRVPIYRTVQFGISVRYAKGMGYAA